jgi:hypothetical protein
MWIVHSLPFQIWRSQGCSVGLPDLYGVEMSDLIIICLLFADKRTLLYRKHVRQLG